jgi:ABC-2 type transport system ATP-binding protein
VPQLASRQVRIFGQDPRVGGAGLRSRIGYLPGEPHLPGNLTVAKLLTHYTRLACSVTQRQPADWRPWAERLDLDPNRRVGELSRGNKQKIAAVQAFSHGPDLFILDEPTSGLDPLVQQEFLRMVRDARAAGQTVFLSSHVLSEIEHVSDRVAVLRDGQIVMTASVSDIRRALGLHVRIEFAAVPTEATRAEFAALPGVHSAVCEGRRIILDVDGSPAPSSKRPPGTN